MIKAIIFDCFGVLTTDGWLPFKYQHFGDKPDLFEQATDLSRQTDVGMIDFDDFLQGIGELAGVPAEEVRRIVTNNVANELLFQYIASRKSKYKIGVLSNASANWLGELFSPDQNGLFDATALSCETGRIKPDERAYEIIAERLGCEPSECIMVDDQERYVTGAKDAGMKGVVYRDFEQCRAELDALLANTEA